jgi:hypothetical protein
VGVLLLPGGWVRQSLLILVLASVVEVLLEALLPRNSFLRRISSPARSFFAFNAASLLSATVFFVSPDRLWRPTRIHDTGSTVMGPEQPEHKS